MRDIEWSDVFEIWAPLVPISVIAGPYLYYTIVHHPGMGILDTITTILTAIVLGPVLFLALSLSGLTALKEGVNGAKRYRRRRLESRVESRIEEYEAKMAAGSELMDDGAFGDASDAFAEAHAAIEDARSEVQTAAVGTEAFDGLQARIDTADRRSEEAELGRIRSDAEAALSEGERHERNGEYGPARNAFASAATAFEDAAEFARESGVGDPDELEDRADAADRHRIRARFLPELGTVNDAIDRAEEQLDRGQPGDAEGTLDDAEGALDDARDIVSGSPYSIGAFGELKETSEKFQTVQARAELARHRQQAAAALAEGDDCEAAGDVDAAHDAYERAVEAFGRAASVARAHDVGDADELEAKQNEAKRKMVHDEISPELAAAHDALEEGHDHVTAAEYEAAVEAFEAAAAQFENAADEAAAKGSDEAGSIRDDADDAREQARRAEADGLVAEAGSHLEDGDAAFEEGAYGTAAEEYGVARDRLADAVDIADEWGFDDRSRIDDRRATAAEKARRATVHDGIATADSAMEAARAAYDDEQYDDAVAEYDTATSNLEAVLSEFDSLDGYTDEVDVQGVEDVESMLDRARQWWGYATIAKTGDRVEDAYDTIEEAPDEALEAFRDVVEYLEELTFDDEGLADQRDELLDRAYRGVLAARLERERTAMRDAEALYADDDRYEAKEQYASVGDRLEEIAEQAGEYGVEFDEVDRYAEACEHNEGVIDRELTGLAEDAGEGDDLRTVDELDRADGAGDGADTAAPPGDRVADAVAGGDVSADDGVDDILKRELPDHEVLEFLGSGGTGEVHRIKLAETGAVAALKVPSWEGTLNQRVFDQFTDEAETWSKLDDHENVVDVYDWGTSPYPWIVMEYLPESLADRAGDLSLAEKRRILTGVADGLEHAHGTGGVVHLDVKPDNVLLTEEGVPKVGDWGVSQVVLEHFEGDQMGLTPAYSAPEQLGGDGEIDRRTDLYQLGVLSYEVLTGRRPFDADQQVALRNQILETPPDPPSSIAPELPAAVDDPVLRALEKRPGDRYEAVILYRDALREALAEQTA